MMRFLLIGALVSLSACTALQDTADQVAREQAKTVVNGIVAERLQVTNIEPVTDCIIDAASAQEILTIAATSVTGDTADTARLVLEIAARPEAVQCIAAEQLRSFQL